MTAPPDEGSCARSPDLVAWLQGELTAAQAAELRRHVARCALCQVEAEELRPLLRELRNVPEVEPPPDLAPRIEAAVRALHFLGSPAAAACAGVALAAVILLAVLPGGEAPPGPGGARVALAPVGDLLRVPIRRGISWLLSSQEEDGSWDVDRWGGQRAYEVGVTGLALAALTGSERDGPAVRRALRRGVIWMLGKQRPDGRLGPPVSGSLYNHGPATVALLAVNRRYRSPVLAPAIKRALAHILRTQDPSGGWGYLDRPRGRTNVVVSTWPLQALVMAREQGHPGLDAAIGTAHRWLRSLADAEGRVGYDRAGSFPNGPHTVAALGVYGLAISGSPDACPSPCWAAAPEDLVGLRYGIAASRLCRTPETGHPLVRRVAARQILRGPFAGSWPLSDPWAGQGGRVYSTAMGVLALAGE